MIKCGARHFINVIIIRNDARPVEILPWRKLAEVKMNTLNQCTKPDTVCSHIKNATRQVDTVE